MGCSFGTFCSFVFLIRQDKRQKVDKNGTNDKESRQKSVIFATLTATQMTTFHAFVNIKHSSSTTTTFTLDLDRARRTSLQKLPPPQWDGSDIGISLQSAITTPSVNPSSAIVSPLRKDKGFASLHRIVYMLILGHRDCGMHFDRPIGRIRTGFVAGNCETTKKRG